MNQPNYKPPNILVTIADDQRHDMLGCVPGSTVATPNLDALAQRGTRMTHAYHQGSMSPAICCPSRAMLHSGRSLFHIPLSMAGGGRESWYDNVDDGDYQTLGESLRNQGYHTHLIGKWHNGHPAAVRSFDSGECYFPGGMDDHYGIGLYDFDRSTSPTDEPRHDPSQHSSDLFANAAVRFIDQYDDEKPFFLYVAFTAPHDPRQAPQEYLDLYPAESMTLPMNFSAEHPFDNGELMIRDEKLANHPRSTEEIQQHIAEYHAITEHMDAAIGRIYETLAKAGQLENTLVIHTGDHGLAVGQHGLMGKQNLYDHSIRVPMIAAGPGVTSGRTCDALCYQHDLYPTLLNAAGMDSSRINSNFQSFDACLSGDSDKHRKTIFCAYRDLQRTVTDGHHKLIRYSVPDQPERDQVFELSTDPWETQDLSAQPESQEMKRYLACELDQWQTELGDPLSNGIRL